MKDLKKLEEKNLKRAEALAESLEKQQGKLRSAIIQNIEENKRLHEQLQIVAKDWREAQEYLDDLQKAQND